MGGGGGGRLNQNLLTSNKKREFYNFPIIVRILIRGEGGGEAERKYYMCIYLCVHQPITDDDVDRIATCLKVLAEKTPLMGEIFNTDCRQSLSLMLAAKMEEEKELQRVNIASIFSMIHLFILNMNILNILLCTVMRFTTCLWFKNLFLLPSPSFLSEGTREAKEALFLNEAFLIITLRYIENKAFYGF